MKNSLDFLKLFFTGEIMRLFFYFLLSFAPFSFLRADEEVLPVEQNLWQTFSMIAIAVAFFYFILWRPEQQRRKALETQRAALKQGDKVVAMGIIGNVIRLENDTAILKMYDGSKIEVLKAAITEILPKTEENKEIGKDKEAVK
jgi:preprotein translocase subunit YajC